MWYWNSKFENQLDGSAILLEKVFIGQTFWHFLAKSCDSNLEIYNQYWQHLRLKSLEFEGDSGVETLSKVVKDSRVSDIPNFWRHFGYFVKRFPNE